MNESQAIQAGMPLVGTNGGAAAIRPFAACSYRANGLRSPVDDPNGPVLINDSAPVAVSAAGQFRLPVPYCLAVVEFASTPAAGAVCGPGMGRTWLTDRATGLAVLKVLSDPPLSLTADAGGTLKLCAVAKLPGREVEFVRPTAGRTGTRYPGRLNIYNRDADSWVEPTTAVWLTHPQGNYRLPTDVTQGGARLTTDRVPCTYQGPLAATGVPVYTALITPGTLLFWECVSNVPVYTYDPQA